MKVTITSFERLAYDANGNVLPIGDGLLQGQKLTGAGNATALTTGTNFIRVATDTAIHIKPHGTGAADTDPMMPANSVEFFNAKSGMTPSIITA